MDDDLGLGELTDDQLVELARAIAGEMAGRDAAVYAAARDATADVRARRTQDESVADRIWATQWSDWARVRRAALMIDETLGPGWRFTVWRSAKGERRVYLDHGDRPRWSSSDAVRAHHGRQPRRPPAPKVSFFVDGSGRYPPGHLHLEGGAEAASTLRLEAIARYLAACWDERATVGVEQALAIDTIAPAPPPPYYA